MINSRSRKRTQYSMRFIFKLSLKIVFFALFIITLFFLVAKFKTYFPIKSVKVFGMKHLDQEDLQQILTPLVHKGFFAIDVEIIKDRIVQSSWVSQANVQRIWPDKVLITIVEKQPAGLWNESNLISDSGEIFTAEIKKELEGLPQFVGPEGRHLEILDQYKKLNLALKSLSFKIIRLELTPELCWNLTFENGAKMRVGHKDVLTSVNHFVKVYPKIIGDRLFDVEYIDLRYHNGLAIKWKTIT